MTDTVRLVKEFGFYPHPLQIEARPVMIGPLPDLQQITSDVLASGGIEKGWIYAPLQRVECPYATRVFGLPKTHSIEHVEATSEDHIEFHIWALSFFVGMRLTATEAGFLDATPLKPHRLVDFIPYNSSLTRAVQLAEDFWMANRHKPYHAKRFVAAVHALFLSQYPQSLQFERFVLLYMAIDACFRLTHSLHKSSKYIIKHADRIAWMCDQFGIECPGWADPANSDGSEIASIRNDTLHEALFMGAPLGFAVHGVSTNQSHTLGQNLPLEMRALVCRLLVALIGGNDAAYIRSPVNDRQRRGLDLN